VTRVSSDQSHSARFRRGAVAGVGAMVRGRLIELVDRVDDAQTVVITAPPGWGKSELLRTWAEHRRSSMAMAWVALEAGDDSPARFWRRFLAAVRDSSWDQRVVLETVRVSPDVEGERGQVVRAILDRLPAEAPTLAIVIDDVHLLSDGPAAEDLAQLLRYLPPSWRLVVSGRSLPLPMMRLRVAGQITSITRSELAFDDADAVASAKWATGASVGGSVTAPRRRSGLRDRPNAVDREGQHAVRARRDSPGRARRRRRRPGRGRAGPASLARSTRTS